MSTGHTAPTSPKPRSDSIWRRAFGLPFMLPMNVLLAAMASRCFTDAHDAGTDSFTLIIRTFFAGMTLALVLNYLFVGIAKIVLPSRVRFIEHSFAILPWTTAVMLIVINFGCLIREEEAASTSAGVPPTITGQPVATGSP